MKFINDMGIFSGIVFFLLCTVLTLFRTKIYAYCMSLISLVGAILISIFLMIVYSELSIIPFSNVCVVVGLLVISFLNLLIGFFKNSSKDNK